tara:strand:- start:426497 stop:427972 length:1476 start_codon:yes stop_codon:yes gene_type:complete
MEMPTEYLAIATTVLAAIAALFSILTFFASRKDNGGTMLRDEAERIRYAAEEQSRGLRQELGALIAAMGQKLDFDIGRMGTEANAGREALRETIEAKLEAANVHAAAGAKALREELTANFGQTSQQLATTLLQMGDVQKERLERVTAELATMSQRQTETQEGLKKSVENRLDTLRTENALKLDEMRQTVDEKLQTTLEQRLGESFRIVSEQLERVHLGLGEMQVLATGVGDLKKVLTNVKTRGTWGEVQLGMLLEQYLSPDQYIVNAQVKAGSGERVEFAVRFPGRQGEDDVLLPIDSKFPQEDYERLVVAAERGDAAAVDAAIAALEVRVRSFAKSISEKYINAPVTTDYAILFLPTEGLYAEVLRRAGLTHDLQVKYRITVAGPTTLSALLSAYQSAFRSIAIQKRSGEVWKVLGAVRTEFANHGKVVDRLKSQLGAATNTIDQLGTRTRAMNRTLKDVEMLEEDPLHPMLDFTAGEDADETMSSTDDE